MNKIKEFIKFETSGWKTWEIVWLLVATVIVTGLSIYWKDTWFGIISALTGIWCVILTGKGKRSCYIVGLINTLMYAWISFGAKFYGEVMLNAIYYAPMQFYGWYVWSKNMNAETSEVNKRKMSATNRGILVLSILVGTLVYGFILQRLGGNLPYADSFTTVVSVIAMIISIQMCMEQWILWVFVNVVTICLWAFDFMSGNSNMATLLMWVVYLFNSVLMLVKWYKEANKKN
jgi:nicotinamide mononucleotide transporter